MIFFQVLTLQSNNLLLRLIEQTFFLRAFTYTFRLFAFPKPPKLAPAQTGNNLSIPFVISGHSRATAASTVRIELTNKTTVISLYNLKNKFPEKNESEVEEGQKEASST